MYVDEKRCPSFCLQTVRGPDQIMAKIGSVPLRVVVISIPFYSIEKRVFGRNIDHIHLEKPRNSFHLRFHSG